MQDIFPPSPSMQFVRWSQVENGHNGMNPMKPLCRTAVSKAAFQRPGRREVTATLAPTEQSNIDSPVEAI